MYYCNIIALLLIIVVSMNLFYDLKNYNENFTEVMTTTEPEVVSTGERIDTASSAIADVLLNTRNTINNANDTVNNYEKDLESKNAEINSKINEIGYNVDGKYADGTILKNLENTLATLEEKL